MATVFAPVAQLTAAEYRRSTEVTYLGQVHGTMAALRRMRERNSGTIVNVGSALAYRAIPLQSAYCGAKFAVRGFTESLRSEIIHDRLKVHLTMVDLPAMNTPQFDWALNKTGRRAQPVPPIFQPEVAARAIYFASVRRRRQIWLGFPTLKTVWAARLAPGLIDRYLAKAGYTGQITSEEVPPGAPSNLMQTVPGPFGAHGRFDSRARYVGCPMFTDRHGHAAWALAGVALLAGLRAIRRRRI
jgi:short-subunit dehydrogenase